MATLDAKIPEGPIKDKWTNHKNHINVVNPANKRSIDVIVVGTGLAGGSAAASLAEMGYSVKAFCFQDSPRRAHSIAAQGGVNAAKNYQKALEIDPTYFPTYTGYAFILIKDQRFEEAEALLEKAKVLSSRDDSDIFFYLGMLNQHKGETDQAIAFYNKAIQHSINQSQIDLNLKFISVG